MSPGVVLALGLALCVVQAQGAAPNCSPKCSVNGACSQVRGGGWLDWPCWAHIGVWHRAQTVFHVACYAYGHPVGALSAWSCSHLEELAPLALLLVELAITNLLNDIRIASFVNFEGF